MKNTLRLALIVLAGAVQAQPAAPVNGNAENGAQVYYDYGCYGCHGYSGYGRQDLNNTGSAMLVNEDIFRAYLRGRADVAPLLPATNMPNYPENSLSNAQVSDLYAYIRSMPDNRPETASIPAFQKTLEAAERPYRPD